MAYTRVLVLTILFATAWSRVDAATATWDRNPETVLGYVLSYGTQSGVHPTSIDVGNVVTYQFFPPVGQRYYVVVQAYNSSGLGPKSAEVILDLTTGTNLPPTLAQPANQSTVRNQSASLTLVGSDPEGAALTYGASGLPPGLALNATTGVISGTPTTAGSYSVTATVRDGVHTATRTFTWTIAAPANQPPALTQPANQSTVRNQAVSLRLVGSDPEGAALTYGATGLPPGLAVNATSGMISGTPTTVGGYTVAATVRDGVHTTTRTFTWTITSPANQPPTLTQPANQSTVRNRAASLRLVGADPEGAALRYSASGLPPGLAVNGTSGMISGTPTTAGTFSVVASVSDGSLSASRTFSWRVTQAATDTTPPTVALTSPSPNATVSGKVYFAASASDANGVAGVRFRVNGKDVQWEDTALPYAMNWDSTSVANGTYQVTAVARDRNGNVAVSKVVSVLVRNGNGAKTAAARAAEPATESEQAVTASQAPAGALELLQPEDQVSAAAEQVSLQISAAGANGSPLQYRATGLPQGLAIDRASGLIAGAPVAASVGEHSVTATVSNGAAEASRTFSWTIQPAALRLTGDFDGDGRADPATYRESTGEWTIRLSSQEYAVAAPIVWGVAGDVPVPADYDGDRRTDLAFYRPATGTWHVLLSQSQSAMEVQWGNASDRPVTMDVDKDGRADLALPRRNGYRVLLSGSNYMKSVTVR